MTTLVINRNYNIREGRKIIGEMHQAALFNVTGYSGVNSFDTAKIHMWKALERFIEDFDWPTEDGTIYSFNPSEMDLDHEINHEYFGMVEGFTYDDGVTQWDATIYEKYDI